MLLSVCSCVPQRALYSPIADAACLAVSSVPTPLEGLSAFYDLELESKYALVYDVDNAKILFAKGSINERVYPASLTKLYTSYVALKYIDADEIVTVGADELSLVRPRSSMAYIGVGA